MLRRARNDSVDRGPEGSDSHCELCQKFLPWKNPLQEGVRERLRAETVGVTRARKGLRLQVRCERDSRANCLDSRGKWVGVGSSHRGWDIVKELSGGRIIVR